MSKSEKMAILSAPCVGYVSAFGGLEVKSIEHGIEDYVLFVAGAWSSARSAHRAKIHYEGAEPYFMYRGSRVKFCDIIRY